MTTAYAILCTMVFSATLNVIYFSKKHIKSKETETFSILLFINLIGLIVEFICSYIGNNFIADSSPARLFTRVYLGYLMLYLLYMTLYIYVVCYASDKNTNLNYYKKLEKISYVIYLSCLLIDLFLPLTTSAGYATGKAIDFVYLCSSICIGIWFIPIIKNRKKINFKKFIPLFCYILLIGIIALIQKMNPHITLVTIMEFLIIFIMYHTIENPDTKVLEEVHKAKKISDNANEEKTMFLYNMTNEIRNITKDINYSADGILDEADNKEVNIENIKTDARDIKGSTAKFMTMTNEILDISSIDSSNIKIYNEKYNIKLIIKEVYALYKSKCDSKNIAFRLNVSSDVPEYLYGDSVGLKRALLIILDNSVKYTDKGYIEFNINTIVKHDICRVIISIEDSGCGIKADNLVKIFNKKEGDQEEDNNLYTAKKLITLMGGTIIPSSVYDKGTTIKVVLDQKIVNNSNNDLEKYEEVYDKKRVLLVDDNEASTKIITKLFEKTNIVLESVRLGSECLDKIRNKEKYDLILIDEDMKPLDGIMIMKKLQSIRMFNTKVILLTRNNNYEYNEEYLKYGFSDYILKPIDKDKFREKVGKYLK